MTPVSRKYRVNLSTSDVPEALVVKIESTRDLKDLNRDEIHALVAEQLDVNLSEFLYVEYWENVE